MSDAPDRDPSTLRDMVSRRGAIGTFLKIPRREVVELLATTGIDFLVCDLEHAQITERECRDVILSGRAADLPVVVRVADLDRGLINRLLEAGAAGIQVPRISAAADIERASALCRYPPHGTRSISLGQPAAGYGRVPLERYVTTTDAATIIVGQFESVALDPDVKAALALLDVLFIGTVDLKLDFDSRRPDHAGALEERIAELEAMAHRARVPLGAYVGDAATACQLAKRGYGYLVVASDLALLVRTAGALRYDVDALRGVIQGGARFRG